MLKKIYSWKQPSQNLGRISITRSNTLPLLGDFFISASDKGIQRLTFRHDPSTPINQINSNSIFELAVTQLDEYFQGIRKEFEIETDPVGTDFQKKVWQELPKIPYGKTSSYKEIAEKLNHGKSYRAVGSANGKNPLWILVPCHRVIASNGTLGGYAGGLELKQKILAHELKFKLSLNVPVSKSIYQLL